MNKNDRKHNEMNHEKHNMSHLDYEKLNKDLNYPHNNTKHHNHTISHVSHNENFKIRFIVSLFIGLPILFLSPLMGVNLSFQVSFNNSEWIVVILATILFFYGGSPFIKGAKTELKGKQPGMMMLISLGISVAYIYSMYAFIINNFFHNFETEHLMDYFWELASLILIMLLGHWIEMNAVEKAGIDLKKMAELLPKEANVLRKTGEIVNIELDKVIIDDVVIVKAGDSIPVDGIIIGGTTTINESMITGEAKTIAKSVNDEVIGGSINVTSTIKVKVTSIGESSYLNKVMKLVEEATMEKSKVELLANRVAKYLFYIAIVFGIITLVVWSLIMNLNMGVAMAVTVLVIACPHALGLAIPLVAARSTSLGAKNGLLIKSKQALESAKHIDIIAMDKTGTLTKGKFSINSYHSFDEKYSDEDILQYTASLEATSSHPLAISIVEKAKERNISLLVANDVMVLPGIGVQGIINNQEVKIVSIKYLESNSIAYDKELFNKLSTKGNSISYLLINNRNVGLVAQGDEIKEDAKEMISKIKQMGIRPVMLTGDNMQVAKLIAEKLDIEDIYAKLMPEDKEQIIKSYQDKGMNVVMVGDGINDAPSLARANVGIAIGAGTDIAIESADVILVDSKPADIIHYVILAKNTSKKMKENLLWGTGYNIIAIPLASGLFYSMGIVLSPAIGAILMSLSTIIVAINALLLKIN